MRLADRGTTISIAGSYGWAPRRGFVRAFAGDSKPAWSVDYMPESMAGASMPEQLAFGPGFMVVAGTALHEDSPGTLWVEKIGPR